MLVSSHFGDQGPFEAFESPSAMVEIEPQESKILNIFKILFGWLVHLKERGSRERVMEGETTAMQPAWLVQKDGPPKYTLKADRPVGLRTYRCSCFNFVRAMPETFYHVHEHCWEAAGLPAGWA